MMIYVAEKEAEKENGFLCLYPYEKWINFPEVKNNMNSETLLEEKYSDCLPWFRNNNDRIKFLNECLNK